MSSKPSKWDQPGSSKPEDAKAANDAAAAAAAIAAKIAAQFGSGGPSAHDGEYTQDIDINDVRNRYMLTKGTTQQQIQDETGASVSTKGTWYPDRSKATEKDPPLYIHIMAPTAEILKKAIDKVNELISMDLGSLVEDKKDRMRERRKWPEEKLPVGLESIRNFNVRAKVVGPSGSFVKYIQQETGTRVQIKGLGSGFIDQETGQESSEPLYIHITGPEEGQVARAKVLTEDLLLVVRSEHAKMAAIVQQQQSELHQLQLQAAYGGGYQPQQQQPGAVGPDGQPQAQMSGEEMWQKWEQHYAQSGYDIQSQQFKDWMMQTLGPYLQGYIPPGTTAAANAGGAAPPPPSEPAPPPSSQPPPPPPPS